MKKLLLLCVGLAAMWSVAAKVMLPDVVSDNMVLQQNANANLWGWADPHAAVKVETSWGVKQTVKSGDDGRWQVAVATPKGSYEPQTITITSGDKVTLRNILIGEVWFASGQSNMDMPLGGYGNGPIDGANEVIAYADAQRNKIRFVKIPYSQGYTPQQQVGGKWNEFNSATAPACCATGYFFADMLNRSLDVPVGIVESSWGGSWIECWMSREVLAKYSDVDLTESGYEALQLYMRPTAMYNAMIYPLTAYTVKGFLWYQGESNIGRHETYAQRMADMVALWREQWGGGEAMPFYYVEIAPFGYQNNRSAYLREAQNKAQKLIPNSGMVCTNDLVTPCEKGNIHPANKRDVGHRLAFWALNRTYGKSSVLCESMQYNSMEVKDGKAIVLFDHTQSGFGRMYDIQGFEICGADRVFHPAQVSTLGGKQLSIWAPEVSEPVAVRYCFKDFQMGNMINSRGLPLVPFRTDNFPVE